MDTRVIEARGESWEWTPQSTLVSHLLSPPNHINSDWVLVCCYSGYVDFTHGVPTENMFMQRFGNSITQLNHAAAVFRLIKLSPRENFLFNFSHTDCKLIIVDFYSSVIFCSHKLRHRHEPPYYIEGLNITHFYLQ